MRKGSPGVNDMKIHVPWLRITDDSIKRHRLIYHWKLAVFLYDRSISESLHRDIRHRLRSNRRDQLSIMKFLLTSCLLALLVLCATAAPKYPKPLSAKQIHVFQCFPASKGEKLGRGKPPIKGTYFVSCRVKVGDPNETKCPTIVCGEGSSRSSAKKSAKDKAKRFKDGCERYVRHCKILPSRKGKQERPNASKPLEWKI